MTLDLENLKDIESNTDSTGFNEATQDVELITHSLIRFS